MHVELCRRQLCFHFYPISTSITMEINEQNEVWVQALDCFQKANHYKIIWTQHADNICMNSPQLKNEAFLESPNRFTKHILPFSQQNHSWNQSAFCSLLCNREGENDPATQDSEKYRNISITILDQLKFSKDFLGLLVFSCGCNLV